MENCVPVRFVRDVPESRARLGGLAPMGVVTKYCDKETSYFATIPLSDALDVSFFVSTSSADFARTMSSLAHKIHGDECQFVEAVVHHPSKRSERSRYWEVVSPVSLRMLTAIADVDPHWSGCRYLDHKFGGRPGLIPGNQRWDHPLAQLSLDGYNLLFQVAFPSSEDVHLDGAWPFGEMNFYVFYRLSDERHAFKFLWTR